MKRQYLWLTWSNKPLRKQLTAVFKLLWLERTVHWQDIVNHVCHSCSTVDSWLWILWKCVLDDHYKLKLERKSYCLRERVLLSCTTGVYGMRVNMRWPDSDLEVKPIGQLRSYTRSRSSRVWTRILFVSYCDHSPPAWGGEANRNASMQFICVDSFSSSLSVLFRGIGSSV